MKLRRTGVNEKVEAVWLVPSTAKTLLYESQLLGAGVELSGKACDSPVQGPGLHPPHFRKKKKKKEEEKKTTLLTLQEH
jgi:hypothetical protein